MIGSPASNVSVVCIFQNSVGASTRHVFIMGFRHRVMRKVGLKILVFFFVCRALAYGTLSSFVLFVSPPRCSREVEVGELNWEESDILIRFLCCQNLMKSPR